MRTEAEPIRTAGIKLSILLLLYYYYILYYYVHLLSIYSCGPKRRQSVPQVSNYLYYCYYIIIIYYIIMYIYYRYIHADRSGGNRYRRYTLTLHLEANNRLLYLL